MFENVSKRPNLPNAHSTSSAYIAIIFIKFKRQERITSSTDTGAAVNDNRRGRNWCVVDGGIAVFAFDRRGVFCLHCGE